MAENYGSLTGTLDAHDTLEGNLDNHGEMSGEVQFGGVGSKVDDVLVNGESVVENKIAHIDLTPYAEIENVYDKTTIDTALQGKADVEDIPTDLSELQDDADHRTVTDAEKTEWSGKADTSDIPTALSQLDNDDNYVQDVNYVHTDNNFTNDDKAAIGGIPENITDLSDVEVSNIQNGQVLKWDSNQNKFVNANESGGGSGDVVDVKVNGTSVVDPVTKEANIDLTGYAETADIPTDLADLSDDATHRLVTDTEKSTWDNKADVSDIPTVNNNTITIQKNGQNVDSFTLNQNSNKAINIAVPTKTSDLQNDDSFITNTVNNLANYYLKSDTYTQTEVNNLISAAVNGRFEKVTTLPASGEPNVIYLVPKTTALTNNVYDEYIWQDNAWELLGSTEIDLSNYVTTTDLSTALADYVTSSTFNTTIANYYTKTEVGTLLDGKVDKVSGKGLSTNDYDNTAKGKVDALGTASTKNVPTSGDAGNNEVVLGNDTRLSDARTPVSHTHTTSDITDFPTMSDYIQKSNTSGLVKNDGTIDTNSYATTSQIPDISGKADKVSDATNGNLAGLNASGNLTDSTWSADKNTTSATGNPISISGLKSNQLAINPIITFEPIQAGSGTPSPSNIRAISGYDKIEALSCGKNIWLNGNVSGTTFASIDLPYALEPGTYTLSAIVTSSDTDAQGCLLYDTTNNTNLGSITRSSARTSKSFTITQKCKQLTFYASTAYQYSIGDTFSFVDIQLEKSNSATSYEPPIKTTSISESLGQTVYWGRWKPRTGEFEVLGGSVDLGTLTWQNDTTTRPADGATIHAHFASFTDCKVISTSAIANMYCSIYAPSTVNKVDYGGGNEVMDAIMGGADNNRRIWIYDSRYNNTSAADFKTAMSGIMLIYELATPFTIQLTPHEISLLKDYAYVSTNGTSIALDYHNGELASLSDVSQLGETVNALPNFFLPDYANALSIHSGALEINSSYSEYIAPQNGYIIIAEMYGAVNTSSTPFSPPYFDIRIDQKRVFSTQAFLATNERASGTIIPIAKGSLFQYRVTNKKLNELIIWFAPIKYV